MSMLNLQGSGTIPIYTFFFDLPSLAGQLVFFSIEDSMDWSVSSLEPPKASLSGW